ncbi:hypothetical protein PHYBOEH_005440 [Phytophthora boehmeriae]|uniref:RanBP2-type domain-containing protein n=1 Tax=Phytophthora boehmeriae TaxID=109152 RepID=A0A8T1WM20_9STRA|nr:hypothetical protein PHYBOEH_005440 [Phytophthora boehmeriae]
MELATEHVRMLDAGRQHVSYSSPLTTDCFASVKSKKTQLLQHGNTFGLSFVASENGFVVAKHDAFEASCRDYIKRRQEAVDHGQKLTLEEIDALPAAKEIQLPSIAYCIALSTDELTVAVAYGDSVALFEVAHILEAETPAPFQTFSKLQVQEITWCTEPSNELFAALTMEKQVFVCSFAGEKDAIETQSASTSICWSPSGEHIAIGSVDATIEMYGRTSQHELILAGYHKYDEENEETTAMACLFEKDELEKEKCLELDEVVGFFDVENRRHQYFSVFLPDWRMFFIGCSLSADIELLVSDPDNGEWELWKPTEKYQARLPMNAEDEESFPMGLALNLNSTAEVAVDDDTYPPVPIVSCSNTEGLLINFAFVDTTVNDELEFVKSPTPFVRRTTRSVVTKQEPHVDSETNDKIVSHEYGQNDENEFAESNGEDSDEEEERKEEEDTARVTFRSIAADGTDYLTSDHYAKLFKALGATYSEDEHGAAIGKLEKDGKVYEDDFVSWYVNWIFGDEDSDDDSDGDAPAPSSEQKSEMKTKEEIAAAFSKFTAKEGSWRCAACMVNNDPDAHKCRACETPNPDAPKVSPPPAAASVTAAGGIGAGGFSFPASTGVTSSFSFGATPNADADAPKPTGFSFGAIPSTDADTSKSSGFSFGNATPATGFSFPATTKPVTGLTFGTPANSTNDKAVEVCPTSSGSGDQEVVMEKQSSKKNISHEYGQNDENEFAESNGEDSDEEEERKEEEDTARVTFRSIAADGTDYLTSDHYAKLFKALGATYSEDEHGAAIGKLEKDGKVYEDDFVSWYVNWIFGDEDSDDDSDGDAPAPSSEQKSEMKTKEEIAAAFSKFTAKEGSWRCAACMVNNDPDAHKCRACETPNPDAPKVSPPPAAASVTAAGGIGAGGFSFPASTGVTSSFSFGATPNADADAPKPTGFSFGAIPSTDADTSKSSGFSFGNATPATGFSFPATTKPVTGLTFGTPANSTNDKPVANGGAHPPDTSSKPKPPAFGTASSGYPPDTSSKPKPPAFGTASSGYPPDTSLKPKLPTFGQSTISGGPGSSFGFGSFGKSLFGSAQGTSLGSDPTSQVGDPASVFTPKTTKSVFGNTFGSSGATEKASEISPSPFGLVPKADTKSTFSFATSSEPKGSEIKTSSARPSFSFDSPSATVGSTKNTESDHPKTKRTLTFSDSTSEARLASTSATKVQTEPAIKASRSVPSSQMEGQLWKLIVDFDKSFQRVNRSSKNIMSKDPEFTKKLMVKLDALRAQVSSLCEEINSLDDLRDQIEKDVLFVIGSDGDVHEQLEYGREILRSFNDEALKRTLEDQPLDQRSKETWVALKGKLDEVERCCAELDNHLSSSKIGADGVGAVSSAYLFRVLKQTYDNSKMQYNSVCKLAEHLERLSMRGSRLGHTNGASGISSDESESHLRASKAEMVQSITEAEQRSQDVRQHFLSLCNNVVTPRDVFSTPRRKLTLPTPSDSSSSPLRVKACSKLMPKTQLSVASPMSSAKQPPQSISFKDTPVKSGSKLFSLAEAMAPKQPAKFVQTPKPAQPSVGVGKAPQRPSLGAPGTEAKSSSTASSLPGAKSKAFSFTKASQDKQTAVGPSVNNEGDKEKKAVSSPRVDSTPSFGVSTPADKRSSPFSLGGKDAPASARTFGLGSTKTATATAAKDFKGLLERFYRVHNPSKTAAVIEKALATYKDKEEDLFTRLFTMYVPDSTPDDIKKYLNGGPVPPKMENSGTSKSLAPTGQASKAGFGSFGVSNAAKDTTAKPSPFGASTPSPFGTTPSAFSLGPAANTSGFGGFGSTSTASSTTASPFGKPAVDYRQKLVEFYQKHNPEKLSSVDTTLQKYKGREEQLFQNLATKYKVNAAGGASVPPASPAVQPAKPNASASPFGKPGAFSAPSTASGASFGSASSVGFGTVKPPAASPFGAPAQTSSGFGSSSGSVFGSTPTTQAFGSPSPFGATAGGFGTSAGGVDYRQKLTEFYQRHNPTKLNSVDATLAKYKGREDRLFAMLEQKYLGKPVPAAPATGGFGIPSTTSFGSGSGSGFGASSTLGGASPTPAFGSASSLGGAAQPAFGSASGFGTTSSIGGGFGSTGPAASGGGAAGSGFSSFGGQTPSFGGAAQQQQSGGFGAATPQSGGFGGAANSGGFGSGFGQQGAFSGSSFTQMR